MMRALQLLGMTLIWTALVPAWAAAAELSLIHLDVGHGDATLILGPTETSGNRVSVLVDAGRVASQGKDVGQKIAGALANNGIRHLDYFIATHYDPDHLGGLLGGGPLGKSFLDGPDGAPATGDEITVGNFVDRGDISDLEPTPRNTIYNEYLDTVANTKSNRISIRYNDLQLVSNGCNGALSTQEKVNCFGIDLGGGASMELLAANGFVRGGSGEQIRGANSENERSLSFLVSYRRFHYLVGGDLTGHDHVLGQARDNAKIERAIGHYLHKKGIRADVLHVNGHGSPNGSDWEFLKLVRPKVAVISVGNGEYGFPALASLQRLINVGVHRVYQTHSGRTAGKIPLGVSQRQEFVNDDIVVVSDGKTYQVVEDRYKTNP